MIKNCISDDEVLAPLNIPFRSDSGVINLILSYFLAFNLQNLIQYFSHVIRCVLDIVDVNNSANNSSVGK